MLVYSLIKNKIKKKKKGGGSRFIGLEVSVTGHVLSNTSARQATRPVHNFRPVPVAC